MLHSMFVASLDETLGSRKEEQLDQQAGGNQSLAREAWAREGKLVKDRGTLGFYCIF